LKGTGMAIAGLVLGGLTIVFIPIFAIIAAIAIPICFQAASQPTKQGLWAS